MGPAVAGKIQGPTRLLGVGYLDAQASEGCDTAITEQKGATLAVQGQRGRAAWMMPLVLEAQGHPE